MSSWNDFNNADEQQGYALIPKGTLVKVRMTIRPGGFDDPAQGWTDGYSTRNSETGSVYLDAEFVVLDGEFARRKLWSLIGLHSPKGPNWANMGRTLVKAILNSARGVLPSDQSPSAQTARRIGGFADLDGIEFLAKVDWEKDRDGQDKNVIKTAICPDHREYATRMNGGVAPAPSPSASGPSAPVTAPTTRSAIPTRPTWAQ